MVGDGDELAGIKRRARRGSPGVLVEVALPLLGAETWSAQLSQPSTLMPASPPPLPQPPGGAEEGWLLLWRVGHWGVGHTGGERTGWNLEDGDADREARRLLLWALGLGRRLAGWKLERFVRGATASLLSLALLRRSAAGHGNPAWPLPQSSPRHPLH